MIPPDAQRAMSKRAGSTVVEVKGSHAVYVSQPQAVASIIEKAAKGVAWRRPGRLAAAPELPDSNRFTNDARIAHFDLYDAVAFGERNGWTKEIAGDVVCA